MATATMPAHDYGDAAPPPSAQEIQRKLSVHNRPSKVRRQGHVIHQSTLRFSCRCFFELLLTKSHIYRVPGSIAYRQILLSPMSCGFGAE